MSDLAGLVMGVLLFFFCGIALIIIKIIDKWEDE